MTAKEAIKNHYLKIREFALWLLAVFIKSSTERSQPKTNQSFKVLFIRVDRIGDMVLSTPVFRSFKSKYPHTQIDVLTSAANCAILENNPYIDRTLIFPKSKKIFKRIKFINRLRRDNFQAVFDLHADYSLLTALIAFAIGKKQRIGFKYSGREVFFTNVADISLKKDFIDLTCSLLNILDIHTCGNSPELFISAEERSWASNWLMNNFRESKPVLGIHPGAYYETQKWPTRYHAELIRKLHEAESFNLLLFGADSDGPMIKKILKICNVQIQTFISNDLRKFGALLNSLEILICNNSGPLHIASACGIKTISFMGPTRANLWTPRGDEHIVLRRDELPCIGCNRGYCKIKTHDCMRLIKSDQVYDSIERIIIRDRPVKGLPFQE